MWSAVQCSEMVWNGIEWNGMSFISMILDGTLTGKNLFSLSCQRAIPGSGSDLQPMKCKWSHLFHSILAVLF